MDTIWPELARQLRAIAWFLIIGGGIFTCGWLLILIRLARKREEFRLGCDEDCQPPEGDF